MIQLRDYQESVVDAIRSEFGKGTRKVIAQLPTGGGKTAIYSYICHGLKTRGLSAMVLVHRKELLDQGSQSLFRMGVEHSYIASGIREGNHSINMASVGTLLSRLKGGNTYQCPNMIIVDEAHHAVATQWKQILAYFPNAYILGVSATPIRTDGTGLDNVFDVMICGDDHGASAKELIRRGYLSNYTCNVQDIAVEVQMERIVNGDFNAKSLAESIEGVLGCEVHEYTKTMHNKPAIAFYPDIKTATIGAEKFKESGYSAVCVDGKMSPSERKKAINALAKGEINVLTSCDIISEGTDIPVVEGIIMMRKTQSLGLFLQQVGRGLRVCEGKSHAIINDHVGNIAMHGMPCDDREWSLVGVKRRKKEIEVLERITQCDECKTHFPTKERVCPECGWELKPTERRPAMVINGELVSVSPETFEAFKNQMRQEQRKEQAKSESLEDLIRLGVQRGYRDPHGWATAMLKSRKEKDEIIEEIKTILISVGKTYGEANQKSREFYKNNKEEKDEKFVFLLKKSKQDGTLYQWLKNIIIKRDTKNGTENFREASNE